MKPLLSFLMVLLIAASVGAQVKGALNRSSTYSDAVLRQLVRASQLAANRQQAILRDSALRQNETAGIRRHSVFRPTDQAQLERLSAFSGERLRALEMMSEFEEREVSRMQSAYQVDLDVEDANRVSELADTSSNLTQTELRSLLRISDDREWVSRVRKQALASESYSNLLRNRSIALSKGSSLILRMSTDQR